MNKINELKSMVANLDENTTKFYEKGNKTAGVRLRKELYEIRTFIQEVRKDISEKTKEAKKAK